MKSVSDLKVKIFGDGADIAGILELSRKPYIKGFTTNPTLMRKAGIPDYAAFAAEVLQQITDRPVSFEVPRRRCRIHGTPGPSRSHLGQKCLRENSCNQHQPRSHV
jgi:hypothetical protein